MTAKEEAESLMRQSEALRARLLKERQEYVVKVDELDALIMKLPGASSHPSPVSLDEWRYRRRKLAASEIGRPGQPINSRDVLHVTAMFFEITVAQLKSHDRFTSVARARHVAMYLARKLTGESFPEIGESFGGKDHTTVISAVRKIEEQLTVDAELHAEVEVIEKTIREAQVERKPADATEA